MIKQDLVEAKTNVSKRLEYIQGEMKRICDKISSIENKARDQQAVVSAYCTSTATARLLVGPIYHLAVFLGIVPLPPGLCQKAPSAMSDYMNE